MKKYCRYCNNLTAGNGIYCSKRNLCLSETYAKATNTCSDFEFNPMDAFFENERGYKPRTEKPKPDNEQITLEAWIGEDK